MGCAVLPHLTSLVKIIEHGLVDEQQKVRTITALSPSLLAVSSGGGGLTRSPESRRSPGHLSRVPTAIGTPLHDAAGPAYSRGRGIGGGGAYTICGDGGIWFHAGCVGAA